VETYRWKPTQCRDCGRRERKNLRISTRGLCLKCAMIREGESHKQMRTASGPYGEKWARRMLQGVQRKLDQQQAS
jgi:hypothetical protein